MRGQILLLGDFIFEGLIHSNWQQVNHILWAKSRKKNLTPSLSRNKTGNQPERERHEEILHCNVSLVKRSPEKWEWKVIFMFREPTCDYLRNIQGNDGHLIPPELTRDSRTSSWDSLFIYSPISTIEAEIVMRKLTIPVSPHHGVCDEVAWIYKSSPCGLVEISKARNIKNNEH